MGDMSLVGPRPPLAYEVDELRATGITPRLQAMPGITGLWQVERPQPGGLRRDGPRRT